jgi:hypothetical protein
LELLEHETVDVLMTDIISPGGSGEELAAEVLLRWPELHIIFARATVTWRLGGTPIFVARPSSCTDPMMNGPLADALAHLGLTSPN